MLEIDAKYLRMNTMKKILTGLALLSISSFSLAEGWNGGIAYAQIGSNDDELDITLGAIELSLGYEFTSSSAYTSGIDLDLAFGMSDDSVDAGFFDIDVELDQMISLSYVGSYAFNENFYGLFNVGYADAEITGSVSSVSVSASESDFIAGVGLGYSFNDSTALEVKYRQTGSDIDFDLLSLGLTVNF